MSDKEHLTPWSEEDEDSILTTKSAFVHNKTPVKFLLDDKKHVLGSGENILRAIKYIYPEEFRYNVWTDKKETNLLMGTWRDLADIDYMTVRSKLALSFKEKVINCASLNAVTDALIQHCYDNKIDPAKEYFVSLHKEWDQTPRLNSWLTHAYNSPEDEYHQAVASNWIKGMVKRVMIPGCKFDTVLVLEGEQGIGKSTSLEILGGDWHTSVTISAENKDFFMGFQGNMIVEFSEGETLSRSEVKHLKSVISTLVDSYRPPYGREVKKFPRRCVFAMTTNQEEYLKDETGNRRWLPVECKGAVNLEWLRRNRDQLFAEAVQRVLVDEEPVHIFPEEATKEIQQSRMVDDPEREKLMEWYFITLSEEQRQGGVAIEQAFQGIQPQLGYLKVDRMTKPDQMRIGGILRSTLYLKKRRTTGYGGFINRYFPTEKTEQIKPKLTESNLLMEF